MQAFLEKNPVWISGVLAACAAAAFQLGYFYEIGPQFISHMGMQDWLFFTVALLPFVVVFVPVLYQITPADILDRRPVAFFIAMGVLFLPIWFMFGTIGTTLLGALAALVSFISLVKGSDRKSMTPNSVFWGFAGTLLMFVYLGLVIGWVGQLQQCEITMDKSERRIVVYLRAVAEGHLIRESGSTIFVPKGEIKEIRCKWSGPLSGGRFL
jgi:hypothetical protein